MTRHLFQSVASLSAKLLRGFWWSTEHSSEGALKSRTGGMNLRRLRGRSFCAPCAPWRCGSWEACLWDRQGWHPGLWRVGKRRREWGTQNAKSAKNAVHRSRTVGSSILHHMAFCFLWGFPLLLKQHTYFQVPIFLHHKLKIYVIQIYMSFS